VLIATTTNKPRTVRAFVRSRVSAAALLAWAMIALSAPPSRAQEIHIRVLNARNGKPITNECLNVWVAPPQRKALQAPTNSDGLVVLHIGADRVTAEAVSPFPTRCIGNAVVAPSSGADSADAIRVLGGNYIACQEYGRITPGEPATRDLLARIMPSYSTKRILTDGVTASNTCGKFRTKAKPGELVIFERSPTFWERLGE